MTRMQAVDRMRAMRRRMLFGLAVVAASLLAAAAAFVALACLPRLCSAMADVATPVLPGSSADVFRAVQAALAREPGLEQVQADPERGKLRFVQRSRWLGFPDTINVETLPAQDGIAVPIYSRSQIGRRDMGVNRARVAVGRGRREFPS